MSGVRKVHRSGRTAFLLLLTPSEKRKKRETELVNRKSVSLLAEWPTDHLALRPHLERFAALAGKMRNRRDAELQDFKQFEEVTVRSESQEALEVSPRRLRTPPKGVWWT